MIMGSNRIFMTQKFLNLFSSRIDLSDEFSCDQLFKPGDVCHAYCWRSSEKEELFGSLHDSDVTLHSSLHRSKHLVLPEVNGELT